jgi:hypothetical protein
VQQSFDVNGHLIQEIDWEALRDYYYYGLGRVGRRGNSGWGRQHRTRPRRRRGAGRGGGEGGGGKRGGGGGAEGGGGEGGGDVSECISVGLGCESRSGRGRGGESLEVREDGSMHGGR